LAGTPPEALLVWPLALGRPPLEAIFAVTSSTVDLLDLEQIPPIVLISHKVYFMQKPSQELEAFSRIKIHPNIGIYQKLRIEVISGQIESEASLGSCRMIYSKVINIQTHVQTKVTAVPIQITVGFPVHQLRFRKL
jgi:hypothetical protein